MASFIDSLSANTNENGVPMVDGKPADQIFDGVSASELFGDRDRRSGVTFDDLIILPGAIDFGCDDVQLQTRVTRNISLNLPFVSSPMDTVTESEMAIQMALQGGLGVIHNHMPISKQVSEVERVKRFIMEPYCLKPTQTLSAVDTLKKEKGYTAFPITSTGRVGGELLGILTSRDSDFVEDRNTPIEQCMTKKDNLVTANDGCTLEDAQNILRNSKKGKLLIIGTSGELISMIARKDLSKTRDYPLATKSRRDQNLCVAAAVSTRKKDTKRDSIEQLAMVKYIKTTYGHTEVDVIGGNVVTATQVKRLIDAGIDGIRIGMGAGTISTSQIVKAVGRAQLSAVYYTSLIAKKAGIPVIADGGISSTGCATKALAIGASCVMMGSLLAGSKEAPGEYFFQNGTRLKKYRGMQSLDAKEEWDEEFISETSGMALSPGRRPRSNSMGGTTGSQIFSVGVSGAVVDKGTVSRYIPYLAQSLRHGFQDIGARSIPIIHEYLAAGTMRFEIRSQAAQKEGGVHDLFTYKKRLFTS
eukprot:g6558.t1